MKRKVGSQTTNLAKLKWKSVSVKLKFCCWGTSCRAFQHNLMLYFDVGYVYIRVPWPATIRDAFQSHQVLSLLQRHFLSAHSQSDCKKENKKIYVSKSPNNDHADSREPCNRRETPPPLSAAAATSIIWICLFIIWYCSIVMIIIRTRRRRYVVSILASLATDVSHRHHYLQQRWRR